MVVIVNIFPYSLQKLDIIASLLVIIFLSILNQSKPNQHLNNEIHIMIIFLFKVFLALDQS